MNSNLIFFISFVIIFGAQSIVNILPSGGILSIQGLDTLLLGGLSLFFGIQHGRSISGKDKKNFLSFIEYGFIFSWLGLFISFIVLLKIHWLNLETVQIILNFFLGRSDIFVQYSVLFGSILIFLNKFTLTEIFIEERNVKTYKKSLAYLFLGAILFLSTLIFSINISSLSFEDDEYITVSVANNLHETGKLYQWDWIDNIPGQISERCSKENYCEYTRAYMYTYIVAASYKVFGVSEFSTRLPGMILYFFTIIGLFAFLKLLRLKSSFVCLTVLLLVGSEVLFTNFFIGRMYGLLIFTSFLIYASIVLINKYIHNKKLSRIITLLFITPIIAFVGYNSHISFILLLGVLLLFGFLIMKAEILSYFRWLLTKDKKFLVLGAIISVVIISFVLQELRFFSRFEAFFTLRIDSGYYARYFYYIMTSPFGQLGNSNYIIALVFLSIAGFFRFFQERKNIFFTLPFFLTTIFIILHVYFLDTIFFIADRYVAHVNFFAVISIAFTVFILGNSFQTRAKIYYIGITSLILFFGIMNLISDEVNKKNVYANYTTGYEKLLEEFDRSDDVLIGIPIRDYYIQGIGDITRINASQRFHDYTYKRFLLDLESYADRNIYFVYSDVKSFHVDGLIKKYLRNNAEIFSHEGNITTYKIEKKQ